MCALKSLMVLVMSNTSVRVCVPNSVLVTKVLLKASHMVCIFLTDVLWVAQFSLHQTFYNISFRQARCW